MVHVGFNVLELKCALLWAWVYRSLVAISISVMWNNYHHRRCRFVAEISTIFMYLQTLAYLKWNFLHTQVYHKMAITSNPVLIVFLLMFWFKNKVLSWLTIFCWEKNLSCDQWNMLVTIFHYGLWTKFSYRGSSLTRLRKPSNFRAM